MGIGVFCAGVGLIIFRKYTDSFREFYEQYATFRDRHLHLVGIGVFCAGVGLIIIGLILCQTDWDNRDILMSSKISVY